MNAGRRRGALFAIILAALLAPFLAPQCAQARTRTYYVAADEVLWNYAPSGRDLTTGAPLPPLFPLQLARTVHKLIYREYTDASFRTLKPRASADSYLGWTGPVMHAEVGDTIVVTFKNNAPLPLDIEPMSGIIAAACKPIPTGATTTYRWRVPDTAGPGPNDPSSRLDLYGPNADHPGAAMYAGLLGGVIVTRSGDARADGSPKDVDKEVVVGFRELNEAKSALLQQNLADAKTNPMKAKGPVPALIPFNFTVSLNGFSFANMPMVTMRRGERVRWYLFDGYSDGDAHIPTFNGQTVLWNGHRTDSVALGATDSEVADMVPDNPGTWLLYCTLNIHLEAGMTGRYTVTP